MTSHQKRILTALILLPLLIWTIWTGGWILSCGLALTAVFGLSEFLHLFWPKKTNPALTTSLLAWTGLTFFFPSDWGLPGLFLASLALFWGTGLYFLWQYSRNAEQTNLTSFLPAVAGFFYVTCSLHIFQFLAPLDIFVLLACVFASDTGAYYCGMLWGNKKIWPAISPKKTWAGSLGGLGFCLVTMLIAGAIWGRSPLWIFFFLGLALNISAQLGDFFESGVKRWAKVKDSGQILPGHGGILDRLDSILFALPVYYAFSLSFHLFR